MKRRLILLAYFLAYWVLLPFTVLGGARYLDRLLGLRPIQLSQLKPLAMLLTFGGGLLFLEAVREFRRYGGTWPVSLYPPRRLIREGMFAWWRHPIYLFYSLGILGGGFWLGCRSFLLFVYPLYLLGVTIYVLLEEQGLKKRFPGEYGYYRRTTGLLFPRLYQSLRVPFHFLFNFLFRYRHEIADPAALRPPYFVVALHANYLDPFFLAKAIPHPISFVATYELFRHPVTRFIFGRLFCIPRRRFRPDFSVFRTVERRIAEGGVIGIFPEGERSWSGAPGAFKSEALKLLKHFHSVPVVPVRIRGNYLAWPRWSRWPRRAPVSVDVMSPLWFDAKVTLERLENELKARLLSSETGVCLSARRTLGLPRVLYLCPVCYAFETLTPRGGADLHCSRCGTVFQLTADYRLEFEEQGKRGSRSLREVYEAIRVRPCDLSAAIAREGWRGYVSNANGEEILQRIPDAQLSLQQGTRFRKLFVGPLEVTAKRITPVDQEELAIPLREIRSVTVESNDRLQLYLPARRALFELRFRRGSALRWQDWLICLLGERFGLRVNRA